MKSHLLDLLVALLLLLLLLLLLKFHLTSGRLWLSKLRRHERPLFLRCALAAIVITFEAADRDDVLHNLLRYVLHLILLVELEHCTVRLLRQDKLVLCGACRAALDADEGSRVSLALPWLSKFDQPFGVDASQADGRWRLFSQVLVTIGLCLLLL